NTSGATIPSLTSRGGPQPRQPRTWPRCIRLTAGSCVVTTNYAEGSRRTERNGVNRYRRFSRCLAARNPICSLPAQHGKRTHWVPDGVAGQAFGQERVEAVVGQLSDDCPHLRAPPP